MSSGAPQMMNWLAGLSDKHDWVWLIHTSEFTGAITEYNDELTGFDPRFGLLDPQVFRYGGNAYYILGEYSRERNWRVEPSIRQETTNEQG